MANLVFMDEMVVLLEGEREMRERVYVWKGSVFCNSLYIYFLSLCSNSVTPLQSTVITTTTRAAATPSLLFRFYSYIKGEQPVI